MTQKRPDTLLQRVSGWKRPIPWQDKADVIGNSCTDYCTDVLDHQSTNSFWVPGSKLIGVGTAERVAEQHS